LVPPIFHKATHPSEQSGGASSPPDAFATYDIRAAALPGNPYDGHTLGTVIPHMQALIGNVLDRCITDAGYRRHNACPITSSRSTPPGQKSRVTPQIKRESKRRTPSSPPPQGNATAWAAITLPMPFSPPPATTFAAYPRGLTFSGRARRRCHSLVSLSDAAVSREI
jgi:hypothetical protein